MSDHQKSTPPENQPTPTEGGAPIAPDWKTRYQESAEAFRETRDTLNARIATLKGQLTALRARNTTLIEQRETFKSRNDVLKKQQSELRDRVKQLVATRPSLAHTSVVEGSVNTPANDDATVHRLHRHIAGLRGQISDARRLASGLATEVRRQGGTVDAASATVDLSSVRAAAADHEAVAQLTTKLSGERKRATERQQTLKDRLQSARDLAEARRLTVADEIKARKQAEKDRDRAKVELTQANEKLQKLETELNDVNATFLKRLEEANAVVTGLRSQGKVKQEALQAARESYAERVESLRSKLEAVRRAQSEQVSELRKHQAESLSKSEALEAARSELEKAKQGQEKLQTEHETSIANANKQLARTQSNLESSRAQSDELKTKLNEFRQHSNETIGRLRTQLAESKKASEDLTTLQRDIESNKATIAELEQTHAKQKEAHAAQARDLEKTNEILREKLTAARTKNAESHQRLRTAQEQNADLREKVRTSKAQLDGYSSIEDQLSKAQATVEQRTVEMPSAVSAKEEFAATVGELQDEMQANDKTAKSSVELVAQLKGAQEENDKLRERLAVEKKKAEDAQSDFKIALQNTKRDQNASLQEVRDDYNRRLQSMREEHNGALQTLREKLAEVREDRNERVKDLQARLRETKRQLGTIDSRDIDPREHNTPEAMDSFFAEAAEVERYAEFGESLQDVLKSHRVTLNKKKIMDAGVGPGYALAEMLKRYNPRSVHGIDYSAVAIDKCRELMPNGTFTVGSLYDPLPELYDVVLCTEVLEHLEEPETALHQILDALAPGGTAVFTVPDGRVDVSRLHLNFWSPESWERFIREGAQGYRVSVGSFQARESSRYQNNIAIVRNGNIQGADASNESGRPAK